MNPDYPFDAQPRRVGQPAEPTAPTAPPSVDTYVPEVYGASQPAPASATQEYEFVRMPDGSVAAIAKSDIKNVSEIATATQNIAATVAAPKVEQHFYVWLADGSVERVKEADLPGASGTNAVFGHWQRGDNVYQIVGVYPVEDIVKGDK